MDRDYQHQTFLLETESWWYRARRRIILSRLERRFPGRRDLRILDIGCGAGSLLNDLRTWGRGYGLEVSPEAAEVARQRSGCPVWTGAIPGGVPDDAGRFDVVCLLDVIEHLDDDVSGLRYARSLLDTGGALLVTVPGLPLLFGIHDEINHHRRRYTRGSLRAALNDAGFRAPWVSYFNTLLSPLLIPAIVWRNWRRSGHHFEVRTRLDPLFERVFGFERHLMGRLSLPFGLSLIAVADRE